MTTRALDRRELIRRLACVFAMPKSDYHEHNSIYYLLKNKANISFFAAGRPFSFPLTGPPVAGSGAAIAEAISHLDIMLQEFGLYSDRVMRKIGLRRVILCRDLRDSGRPRNGVLEFKSKTLYLDVSKLKNNNEYLRKIIHHEIFHMIDWRDDGHLYADRAWSALNPAAFRYGRGGESMQGDPFAGVLTPTIPGFLNQYSTSGVEEDKAEIYCHLMVPNIFSDVMISTDENIQRKVDFLKKSMNAWCDGFNEEFWSSARSLRRDR